MREDFVLALWPGAVSAARREKGSTTSTRPEASRSRCGTTSASTASAKPGSSRSGLSKIARAGGSITTFAHVSSWLQIVDVGSPGGDTSDGKTDIDYNNARSASVSALSSSSASLQSYTSARELVLNGDVTNCAFILCGFDLLSKCLKRAREGSNETGSEHERTVKSHRLQRVCAYHRMYVYNPADLSH